MNFFGMCALLFSKYDDDGNLMILYMHYAKMNEIVECLQASVVDESTQLSRILRSGSEGKEYW